MKYKGILVIAATGLVGLSLAACGHGSIVNPPHGKVVVLSSSSSSTTNSSNSATSSQTTNTSFNNDVIKTNDVQIKITNMVIVRHSAATNNKTLLRLTYEMTNYRNQKLRPAMITQFLSAYQIINDKTQQFLSAYQIINDKTQKLSTGVTIHQDKQLASQQNNTIAKDKTAKGVITFELVNYDSNVKLVAKDDNHQIGTETIQPTQLNIISDGTTTSSSANSTTTNTNNTTTTNTTPTTTNTNTATANTVTTSKSKTTNTTNTTGLQ